MSADNWAVCPRCAARSVVRDQEALSAHHETLREAYGKVSADEYAALTNQGVPQTASLPPRFRGDYEIYFVDDAGSVVNDGDFLSMASAAFVRASYGGGCENCGLAVKFEHNEPIGDLS